MEAFVDGRHGRGRGRGSLHRRCARRRVVEIAGDYTETLARLQPNPNAVGVFGLSFYEQNTDTLKVATMSRRHALARDHRLRRIPGLAPALLLRQGRISASSRASKEYVEFFLSDEIAGPGGPLADSA